MKRRPGLERRRPGADRGRRVERRGCVDGQLRKHRQRVKIISPTRSGEAVGEQLTVLELPLTAHAIVLDVVDVTDIV